MFNRENRRFLIIAMSLCTVFTATLVALILIYHSGVTASPTVITIVIGFSGVTVNQLLAMFRDEQGTRAAEDSRVLLHEKLNLTESKIEEVNAKVDVAAETAKKVEQVLPAVVGGPSGTPLPRSREELIELMEEVVGGICEKAVKAVLDARKEGQA